ncbi:MAG: NAD(P)-dependent oxidoreductase [Pseudomonadales bacterium]
MQTLPVFLNIQGKRCLLVGSGEVAARKRRLLEKAQAHIVAITESQFLEACLDGVMLVVAASADEALNQRVFEAAQARQIPVNVVDTPALCTFIFPSIVERGVITVAVTSNGHAPVLARLLRARIEALLPASLGDLALQVSTLRKQVFTKITDAKQRMRFWNHSLQRYLVDAGGDDCAQLSESIAEQLHYFEQHQYAQGRVAVVGSGTGDPDLLTFKALRYLQSCDCVVSAAGVNAVISQLARRDAYQINLQTSDDVFTVLRDGVQRGESIVYLVPGDPLSLREMSGLLMRLQAVNIAFEVVPGVIDQNGAQFDAT